MNGMFNWWLSNEHNVHAKSNLSDELMKWKYPEKVGIVLTVKKSKSKKNWFHGKFLKLSFTILDGVEKVSEIELPLKGFRYL